MNFPMHLKDIANILWDFTYLCCDGPQLARLRSFALNILRANDTKNVSQELFINALNPGNLMSYAVT